MSSVDLLSGPPDSPFLQPALPRFVMAFGEGARIPDASSHSGYRTAVYVTFWRHYSAAGRQHLLPSLSIPATGVCCARHTDGSRVPTLARSLPSNGWYQAGPSALPPVFLLSDHDAYDGRTATDSGSDVHFFEPATGWFFISDCRVLSTTAQSILAKWK